MKCKLILHFVEEKSDPFWVRKPFSHKVCVRLLRALSRVFGFNAVIAITVSTHCQPI